MNDWQTKGGGQSAILGAVAHLGPDPLMLHHQNDMIKGLPYLVAGLGPALLPVRRV